MMKNILIFIGGVVCGVLLMIVVSLFIASRESADGITLFEEDGECISENSFQVFQVLESGDALAKELERGYLAEKPTGLTVLFLNNDGQTYYDDQVIKIPSGKCAKQIGVFRYSTRAQLERTVPIVGIRNK